MHNYFIFLDYLELRRRIEKRLARANWLLIHAFVFVAVTVTLLAMLTAGVMMEPHDWFILPPIGDAMAAWSVLLLLHSFWAFARSGASERRRSAVIEREMRERLEQDDTYLGGNPKDAFRVQGLLEEDIQKRASVFHTLRLFATLNAVVWLGSLYADGLRSSLAWQVTPMLGIVFLFVLAFNFWRQNRQEKRVRKFLNSAYESRQTAVDDDQRHLRLSDDGELVEYYPDDLSDKKKKRPVEE